MRIAVGGSSGLIGTALVGALRGRGDEVLRLVRRAPSEPDEREWDPAAGAISGPGLGDVDAVVNLAGAGIAEQRWNAERKRVLVSSRLDTTAAVVGALATSERCSVFLSGSAVGFYGDRADEVLTEDSTGGEGFLADLVRDWEVAAGADQVRVAHLRTGVVLSDEGGMLGRLAPIFRLGAGGRLGDGQQFFAWISLADQVAAMLHLLDGDLSGPVNLTAPDPVRNVEFTAALAAAVHRPAVIPTPTLGLAALLGSELVEQALLASQRVVPQRLLADGFQFRDADVRATLVGLL